MSEVILRGYQLKAITHLRESMQAGKKRVILSLPTGAGKTFIATSIIQSILDAGQRVMFGVDRLQLLTQTKDVFDKQGFSTGVIQGNQPAMPWADLQLASLQTLERRETITAPDYLIVDEAHGKRKKIIERIEKWSAENPKFRVIGLTATPFSKGLGKIYQDLVVVETTKGLIESGYLCDFEVYAAPIDMSGVKTSKGDFHQGEAEKRVNTTKIVGNIVSTWLRLASNRKTVCFAVSVAHSKAICAEFRAHGIRAEHIDAYTDEEEREQILYRHQTGQTQILINVGITVAGWDSPDTTCLIFACPTKSLIKHIQVLGRVLRISSCGLGALILDHGGNVVRNGFPTDTLPDYLDMGETKDTEAKVREKKDPDPIACQKCSHVSTDVICKLCGFETIIKPKVDVKAGELKKLEPTMDDKREWYNMALGWCKSKNKKPGMAYHMHKEKFGVYPTSTTSGIAVKPSKEFLGWITYRNIKYARRRK